MKVFEIFSPDGIRATSLLIIFTLISSFMVWGCGKTEKKEKREPPTHYTIRLKWLFNASTLGEIWGVEKGVFRRYGLSVELKEGGAETDALTELELGRVEFGVASSDQIIRAASKGASPRVILQIFQKNPLQWIYIRERLHINQPRDLAGKTIGITFGGNDETIFRAIMAEYGIKKGDLTLYAVHYDFTPFWKGEVDLWPVYRNTQGVFLAEKIRKKGENPAFFDPNALGISFVANCLVTSEGLLRKDPEGVKKMKRAEARAWEEALDPENEDEALDILRRYNPGTPPPLLREQIRETRAMILLGGGKMGAIDRKAWEETLKIMRREGLIKKMVDLDKILPHYSISSSIHH